MSEYLDPVVKVDWRAQYVDDIGFAANNATDLSWNARAVFKCGSQAAFKLVINKLPFWSQTCWFPWRDKITRRNFTASLKIWNFLPQSGSPNRGTHYSANWVSWTIREFTFPWWLKKLTHSKNAQSRNANQYHIRTQRNIWFSKQSSRFCLRFSIETTHSRETICLHDWSKL